MVCIEPDICYSLPLSEPELEPHWIVLPLNDKFAIFLQLADLQCFGLICQLIKEKNGSDFYLSCKCIKEIYTVWYNRSQPLHTFHVAPSVSFKLFCLHLKSELRYFRCYLMHFGVFHFVISEKSKCFHSDTAS